MSSAAKASTELIAGSNPPGHGLPEYGRFFQSIFECSAAGMLVVSLSGRCIWANPTFCDWLGYTLEEIVCRRVDDITHPEDLAASRQMLQRMARGEAKLNYLEKRYLDKSGRPVWGLVTTTLIPRTDDLPPDCAAGLVQDIGKRKATEEALQRSEALFRTIAENADDLIRIVDYPGLKTLYVSPAYQKLLGYSAEELQDSKFLMVVHPDDKPIAQRAIEQIVKNGHNAVITEMRLRHKSGTCHYVEAHGCAVRNSRGELESIVVVSRINDAWIAAQQKLRDREERLQLLLDSIAESVYGLDMNGNCTFCNQALLRTLGYKDSSELLGKNMHDVIHHSRADGSHYPVEDCCIFKAFRANSLMHVDDEVVWRADGTSIPVEYWSHPVRHEGKMVGAMVTFVDITARKTAQDELRRAHEEAELFINSVPSILIGISRDSQIKRWNLAAEQVFGLAAAQVMGKRLANCGIQWVHPNMQSEIDSWCADQKPGPVAVLPFVIQGNTRLLGLTLKRIPTPEEGVNELLIVASDITEREILGQQLRQAQKLEAIGQLAAGIAHEVNTPTQYVGDNTRFLQESWSSFHDLFTTAQQMRQEAGGGPVSPETLQRWDALLQATDLEYLQAEIPRAIEQSLEGIERVSKIVGAMKEFSHPGSDEKELIDINRAIETTITVARNEWKYVSDVETHLEPGLPLVPCHAGEFKQVILNLLINAAQAIEEKAVEDGHQVKGKIVISTTHEPDWTQISISDTGTGIPEALRSRVFELFFTTKPVGKGTGQGLALVHTAIVRRHGGKVWFDSEVGKGTTFYLRIPLAKSPRA